MIKYTDQSESRLIFINRGSDQEYWDLYWKSREVTDHKRSSKYFVDITKKYLPNKSKILEGGSGLGDKVKGLQMAGYNTIGIDYAVETVNDSIKRYPGLDIRVGDVRKLEFEDSYFDGYWSLGVIEHFWNGYDEIISEAYRVLREGGIFFLTFPSMSYIRKMKVKKGIYKKIDINNEEPENFYQFALDSDVVLNNLKDHGFEILNVLRRSPKKGLEEELPKIHSFLLNCQRYLPLIMFKIIRRILFIILNPFVGHGTLIVAKKIAV